MTKFNWYKALGFGIGIWVIGFALVAIAFGLGIFASVWTQVAIAAIMAVATYAFAAGTQNSNVGYAWGYGAVFAAVGIVLDLIISQRLVSGLFGLWTYYLTYALIVLAPPVQAMFSSETSVRAV